MKSKSEIALYAHITGMDEFQSKLERLIHAAEEFNAAAKALRETKLEVTLSGEEPERTEIWNFHTDMCNPAQTTTISGGVAEGFTQGVQAGIDAEAKPKNRVLRWREAYKLPIGSHIWVETSADSLVRSGVRTICRNSGMFNKRVDGIYGGFGLDYRLWSLPQPPTPEELAENPWRNKR